MRQDSFTDLAWLGAIAMFVLAGLLALSRGDPWMLGVSKEPYFKCSVGSGRLKILWSFDSSIWSDGWWTNSWNRGLDGDPIRWELQAEMRKQVKRVAIPLWLPALFGFICIMFAAPAHRSANFRALRQSARSSLP